MGRVLLKTDRCYEKSMKEANGENSFNEWRDLDDFNGNRKHNQISTIDVYRRQP